MARLTPPSQFGRKKNDPLRGRRFLSALVMRPGHSPSHSARSTFHPCLDFTGTPCHGWVFDVGIENDGFRETAFLLPPPHSARINTSDERAHLAAAEQAFWRFGHVTLPFRVLARDTNKPGQVTGPVLNFCFCALGLAGRTVTQYSTIIYTGTG
jgi:hypothetical protein